MSVRVSTWVWDHSESEGNDRLVLLAIADQCDDFGRNAWPSYARLMEKTHIRSRQTIASSLKRLIDLGELAASKRRNKTTWKVYYSLPSYQQAYELTVQILDSEGEVQSPIDDELTVQTHAQKGPMKRPYPSIKQKASKSYPQPQDQIGARFPISTPERQRELEALVDMTGR